MNIEPAQLLQLMNVLLRALGTRVLCMVALLMTFSLFGWAMYRGSWLSFAVAGAFGFGVLWPVLLASFWTNRGDKDETQ